MNQVKVLIIFVIVSFHPVNCQYGVGRYMKDYAIRPLPLGRPFRPYSGDYFVPRRRALMMERNRFTNPRRRRKLIGKGCNCEYSNQGGCVIVQVYFKDYCNTTFLFLFLLGSTTAIQMPVQLCRSLDMLWICKTM